MMHDTDAWLGAPEACRPPRAEGDAETPRFGDGGPVDMLWVDFGVGDRLDKFLRLYWPVVKPGGFVVVHSTVTNRATRAWLERVRRGEFAWLDETEGDEAFEREEAQERIRKEARTLRLVCAEGTRCTTSRSWNRTSGTRTRSPCSRNDREGGASRCTRTRRERGGEVSIYQEYVSLSSLSTGCELAYRDYLSSPK